MRRETFLKGEFMAGDGFPRILVRRALRGDLNAIQCIYNQGIEDRVATLDADPKNLQNMLQWWDAHQGRYAVLTAVIRGAVVGWASLNPYSARKAYDGVAELSIYVDRGWRNHGLGRLLLAKLEEVAVGEKFYKIVLFTFPHNGAGQRLYRSAGYREVGTFYRQGFLDGHFVDIMAMEKFLGDTPPE